MLVNLGLADTNLHARSSTMIYSTLHASASWCGHALKSCTRSCTCVALLSFGRNTELSDGVAYKHVWSRTGTNLSTCTGHRNSIFMRDRWCRWVSHSFPILHVIIDCHVDGHAFLATRTSPVLRSGGAVAAQARPSAVIDRFPQTCCFAGTPELSDATLLLCKHC